MFSQGQCKVDAVMVLLVQEMIYTCDPGEDSERQKKEVTVVSEVKDESDSAPGDAKVTPNHKLPIFYKFSIMTLLIGLQQPQAEDPP